MNTVFKKLLMLLLLLVISIGFASNDLKNDSDLISDKKMYKVTISNDVGNVVFSAEMNYTGDPESLLDFSLLKNGIYTIEIDKDFEINIEKIQVNNSNVTFLKENSNTIFKPVFRLNDSKISVSKIAFNTERISIKLYYENQLIYSETTSVESPVLNRVFKIDSTKKGFYKTIVKTNNRVYKEQFEI